MSLILVLILISTSVWMEDVVGLRVAIFRTGTRPRSVVDHFGTITYSFRQLLRMVPPYITEFPIHTQEAREFATIDQINEFDLIIIPGAAQAVESELPWMMHLESLIRDERRKPWIFGVCFGHQLACKAMGGQVEVHKQGEELGISAVHIDDPEIADLISISSINVIQSHRRHVTRAPQGFTVWASNEHTPVQGVLSKEHKIFTTQFHPEYTAECYIATRQVRETMSEEDKDKVRSTPLHHQTIKQILDYLMMM